MLWKRLRLAENVCLIFLYNICSKYFSFWYIFSEIYTGTSEHLHVKSIIKWPNGNGKQTNAVKFSEDLSSGSEVVPGIEVYLQMGQI